MHVKQYTVKLYNFSNQYTVKTYIIQYTVKQAFVGRLDTQHFIAKHVR